MSRVQCGNRTVLYRVKSAAVEQNTRQPALAALTLATWRCFKADTNVSEKGRYPPEKEKVAWAVDTLWPARSSAPKEDPATECQRRKPVSRQDWITCHLSLIKITLSITHKCQVTEISCVTNWLRPTACNIWQACFPIMEIPGEFLRVAYPRKKGSYETVKWSPLLWQLKWHL